MKIPKKIPKQKQIKWILKIGRFELWLIER